MHVEIVKINLCFPILSPHPILTIFDNTKEKIIEVLHHNLGSKWNVLCPFGVGCSEQDACAAVVVHIDPMTYANWPNLVLQVKDKATNLKHTPGLFNRSQVLAWRPFHITSKRGFLCQPDNPRWAIHGAIHWHLRREERRDIRWVCYVETEQQGPQRVSHDLPG